jgi:hypothetical protein
LWPTYWPSFVERNEIIMMQVEFKKEEATSSTVLIGHSLGAYFSYVIQLVMLF